MAGRYGAPASNTAQPSQPTQEDAHIVACLLTEQPESISEFTHESISRGMAVGVRKTLLKTANRHPFLTKDQVIACKGVIARAAGFIVKLDVRHTK